MKYQNKQNGKVTKSVEFDEKTRCYDISFEDGSNTRISGSTFKRWYKKLEEEEVQEQKLVSMPGAEKLAELKQEVTADEDTCADGRTYAEIGKEIAEQAKQKAKNAKAKSTPKKSAKKESVNLEEKQEQITKFLVKSGYEVKSCPGRVLRATSKDKRNLYLYLGGKKFVLYFSRNNVPEGKVADRVANCPLSHRFDVQYNELETLKEFM